VQIDWFTFGAQIVNFLILIGLLKRFLYGPILDAMDRRQASIRDRIAEAESKQEEAEQEAEQYRSLQSAFEARRAERMQAVEEDAEARRHELLARAREDVEYLEAQWREAIERDRAAFLHVVSKRAVTETIELTRRILDDLANVDLEEQVVTVFQGHLQNPEDAMVKKLIDAFEDADAQVTIRTACELSGDQRKRLLEVLEKRAGHKLLLSTVTDPGLGLGVEVQVANRTVGWTIDQYIEQLLDEMLRQLEADLHQRLPTGVSDIGSMASVRHR
jgi:F-type H+-transporting ATPase subunit b